MTKLNDSHFLRSIELLRDQVPSFSHYPFSLPAVAALDVLELHPAVTFFVGENGSGKSTLMEAIAVSLGLNAEGGSRNFRFSTRESHSQLCQFIRLNRTLRRPRDSYFLRAESFFNVASQIEEMDAIPSQTPTLIRSYGNRSLHEQSHGESFFALFQDRFGGQGMYLLDEPEAALSPNRQLQFLSILHDLVREGSQFIIATHSPIVMAYPQAWIYTLGGKQIERVPYKQTEHYKLTREFLNKPEKMLQILTEEGPSNED